MRYAVILAAVMASSAIAVNPASSKMMMCSGEHLSKMTSMLGSMPDGSHKSEMHKHLRTVNTAMAEDGMRGCEKIMMDMHQHHMSHMTHRKLM